MSRLRSPGVLALLIGSVVAGCGQGNSKQPQTGPNSDTAILALKPAGTNAVIVHAIGYGTGTITIGDPSQTCVTYDWDDSLHYSQVCWAYVPVGTTSVTVTAAATNGSIFSGWTGPCAGSAGSCSVSMDQDRIMNVGFWPAGASGAKSEYLLSVHVLGFVDGDISAPAGVGLVCEASESVHYARTCTAMVPNTTPPTQVTLTATPAEAGTQFSGWGGNCSGTGTCTVTMDRDVGITAGFVREGSTGGGSGGGSPSTAPTNCGDLAEAGILQNWSHVFAPGSGFGATLSAPSSPSPYRGQSFVRAVTTAAFDFGLVYTAPAPIDATGFEQLRFAVRALNTNILVNGSPWQGSYPIVYLQDSSGNRRMYSPTINLMPRDGTTWVPVTVPIAGGSGWTVSGTVDLAAITRIEIHSDTWEWNELTIDVDGLSFEHPSTTCTSGVAGLSGGVTGVVASGVMVTLSGPASSTAVTDASGRYAFAGLAAGTYTVTPALSGYVFNPAQQTVTIAGADVSAVDFVALPRSYEWSAVGSMAVARIYHTATLLPSGKVLVAGGQSYPWWVVTGTAELYDPATGTWSFTGSMTTARYRHTATLLPSGKVLVAGGGTSSAELYDPADGTWGSTGSMTTARHDHTATLLPSGKVLVVGGGNDGLASAELYDPATGQWTATGSLSQRRTRHAAALLTSGRLLVAGGYSFPIELSSSEVYDPASGLWAATGSLAIIRADLTATVLESGQVLVAGGGSQVAELYDPVAGAWATAGPLASPHGDPTASLLPAGKVLVAGGSLDPGTELFDPVTGTWSPTGRLVTPRWGHTATVIGTEVLVAGGIAGDTSIATATAEITR